MNAVLRQRASQVPSNDVQAVSPQKHNHQLLLTAQSGGQVVFDGGRSFMRAITFAQDGSEVSASVYLQGRSHAVDGREVFVQPTFVPCAELSDAESRRVFVLHCLQTAHPVTHRSLTCFLHTVRFDLDGDEIRSTVYITGKAQPVPIGEITARQRPAAVLQLEPASLWPEE